MLTCVRVRAENDGLRHAAHILRGKPGSRHLLNQQLCVRLRSHDAAHIRKIEAKQSRATGKKRTLASSFIARLHTPKDRTGTMFGKIILFFWLPLIELELTVKK